MAVIPIERLQPKKKIIPIGELQRPAKGGAFRTAITEAGRITQPFFLLLTYQMPLKNCL